MRELQGKGGAPRALTNAERKFLEKYFYRAITAAPVPVDMRALRALKRSPLALDLYAWLPFSE